MEFAREKTKKIFVKNIQIGGNNTVVIQSMTNTKTADIKKTLRQINALVKEGCQIVRVAVVDEQDAQALKTIVKKAKCPVVADIHFNHILALKAIEADVAKIRLNPGNISSETDLKKIIENANKKNIPIRVGVNSGSLPKDMVQKYGISEKSMIETAKSYVSMLEKYNFKNIILSLKTTDPLLAIKTAKIAAKEFIYPLHIGITESGSLFNGTIKSAAALGVILNQGIGNTIRISLTGNPIHEVKVCKKLLNTFNLYNNLVDVISCPTCGRLNFNLNSVVKEIENYTKKMGFPLKVAILGCSVNGPGEAKEADIGIAGGNQSGIIFENGKIIKTVKQEHLVSELKKIIDKKYADFTKKMGRNND